MLHACLQQVNSNIRPILRTSIPYCRFKGLLQQVGYLSTTSDEMKRSLQEQIERLKDFSACDISDALLKLDKHREDGTHKGGYLADIGT